MGNRRKKYAESWSPGGCAGGMKKSNGFQVYFFKKLFLCKLRLAVIRKQ